MKKLLLILLCLPMIGFGQFLCSQLGVTDIVINSANMTIDITIYDGNIGGQPYPYIAYTIDNLGDTIQTGSLNSFGNLGLDTSLYSYSLNSLPNYPLTVYYVYGMNSDTCILSYHPSCDSVITTFNYIDSSSTPYVINLSIETFDLSNGNFGYGGFVLLNDLGDTVAFENINTAGNVFGLMQYNTENRTLEITQNITIPFYGSLHLINGWFAGNPSTSCIFPFTLNGSATSIQEHTTKKELLKITDLLGRETKGTNQLLFYIYDDGTVEKRIVIE